MTDIPDNSIPEFSIVIPAYNAAAFIAYTVTSVQAQTVTGWEIIICDDGSTDDTATVVAAIDDPRLHYIRQEHTGQSAAQNRGFQSARGRLVLFLDADDLLLPDALQRLAAALHDAPEATATYGDAVAIRAAGETYGEPVVQSGTFSPRPSGDLLVPLLEKNIISSGTILIRAEAFKRTSGFNERLAMVQDWEMWCRLALTGPFVFIGGGPVLQHRIRADSVSRGYGRQVETHFKAIDAVYDNPDIITRVGIARVKRLRRRRLGNAHAFLGTEAFRCRQFDETQHHLVRALRFGVARPVVLVLLSCAFLRIAPAIVRRQFEI